jgi:riboflavin kinase / FMN adenylyltransferase
MIHVQTLDNLSIHNCWMTIGVFDGVHLGHQKILHQLTTGAHADGSPAVVITFSPHPAVILGHPEVKCLTTPEERADLLASLGVDIVITYRFDHSVANMSAYQFMHRLKQHMSINQLLMGYDFALGKGREGNAARLREIGVELGYSTKVLEAVRDDSGVISSTQIRQRVVGGDVAGASKMLGHNYSLHGPVVHGNGRGRTINFPTANIDYPEEKLIPSNGIYVCNAWLADHQYGAAVNVGIRPTFQEKEDRPLVEAYLLDFDQDIYGQDVRLEFMERLRDEEKFGSVAELVEQIHRDVAQTRSALNLK